MNLYLCTCLNLIFVRPSVECRLRFYHAVSTCNNVIRLDVMSFTTLVTPDNS